HHLHSVWPRSASAATRPIGPRWISRPLPAWYDQSKIGIFIHWGVFSVPSYHSEWFWWYWQGTDKQKDVVNFMKQNYPPGSPTPICAKFKATFFNPDTNGRKLFDSAGAKYVVFTSKHHEGYCNWDTAYSFNWNSKQVGPNRDLVADLAAAIRKRPGLRFGLYHSLMTSAPSSRPEILSLSKTMPELYELVNRFKPDVVWSDGDWDAPAEYWNSTGFLAWLYNDSPVNDSVVTNDRWGKGVMCNHGGYYTCQDRPHKWENCMTLDKLSWGYRRDARLADYLTPQELLSTLATTISCGGNLLVNVGPTADGTIDPVMEERLRQLGSWLRTNGDARSVVHPAGRLCVRTPFLLTWPANDRLLLGSVAMATNVTLLGHPKATGIFSYAEGFVGGSAKSGWHRAALGLGAAARRSEASKDSGAAAHLRANAE
uniref:alpha-L-fucosidase n=1 Tax=Macrostomum lignano TaxID=282301 RepID=A0A1I8FFM7_9PLAT